MRVDVSSVLFSPGNSLFRGAPLTITRHFLELFCMRAVHFVSHYNETLFMTYFISCLFYKTSYDLSMAGGGII